MSGWPSTQTPAVRRPGSDAPSGSLREATADYLARLDREIEDAQQAVRAASQDSELSQSGLRAQRAAKAYLDGQLQEWDRVVAWVRWINDAALAVLAVTEDQQ